MKKILIIKYFIILFIYIIIKEISFSQVSPNDDINAYLKASLSGSYYLSTNNSVKWGTDFKYGFGSNIGFILDAGSIVDLILVYSHYGFKVNSSTTPEDYDLHLSSDNISINIKFKFSEQNLKPYLLLGFTQNYFDGKRYYKPTNFEKIFRVSYLTEDIGLGISYKISSLIELDNKIIIGFQLSEIESMNLINRINFNLGIIFNLLKI